MMRPFDVRPNPDAVQAALEEIAPGSILIEIGNLPASFSNYTHLIRAKASDGTENRYVVRRFKVSGAYDRGEKAVREYKIYKLLRKHGLPAPEPIYLDQSGKTLEIPGLITKYIPGSHVYMPDDLVCWSRTRARLLAQIHALPVDESTRSALLDNDEEISWFIRTETPPEQMLAHPDGTRVWQAVKDVYPRRKLVNSCLTHVDYWAGNMLWQGDEISAVLDWEEAAYGDPGGDVAYARMDMILSGPGWDIADEFLHAYQAETGEPVANLALWELCAAARPMFSPSSWITTPKTKALFREFITRALEQL